MPQPLTLESGRLPAPLSARYWDDGFLFPMQVVSPEKALGWRKRLERIERDWLDNGLTQPLNTYKRINAHVVMPLAAEIGLDPAVLDVVEGVLGPDILLFSVEFFIKEPRTEHIVSMHQDLTYWGMGEIDGLVTAWIALSPATPASGCMDFVRGSHKNPILPHEDTFDDKNLLSRGQEIAVEVAEADKTPIEIHPGQMSLHHGLMIHGSGPNQSDDRRIAAVIRYMQPGIVQEGIETFAVQARGTSKPGLFTPVPVPTEDFAPEAQAMHDRMRRAQASVTMKGTGRMGVYGGKS